MRRLLFAFIVMTSLSAYGTGYDVLKLKANRFFEQKEWRSASAMFELMLDQRPTDASTYGKAIVTSAMQGDSLTELSLMKRSIVNQVPFDSVFAQVKKVSFAQGECCLYEDFLIRVRKSEPWLSRSIDYHLMNYYIFRRDGAKMVEYSQLMLNGLPGDANFMMILADGYMLTGDTAKAIDVYQNVLSSYPDNYDALLKMGNYYFMKWERGGDDAAREKSIAMLQRVQSKNPTPYIDTILRKLINNQ